MLQTNWRDGALCEGKDSYVNPEWFYSDHAGRSALAARLCDRCPVRAGCLDHAMRESEEHGIWGGTTPEERFALGMVRRPIELVDWVEELRRKLAGCESPATYTGVRRHEDAKEDLCPPCLDFRRQTTAARVAAARARKRAAA